MVALIDRRRVISTLDGGRALVDLDSLELRGENGCDRSGGKGVGVTERNGPRLKPGRQFSYKDNINHIAAETLQVESMDAQYVVLFTGLYLIALGTGGIKPCVSSFGAD
ncbi:hypothetical protein K1719_013144 [Acacia pycnantha]|nr:hypothetical protein K1719_013144 [Acacia pycnantha]